MTDIIKSLKYIDITSITIMGTSINFILSTIIAIILLMFLAIRTGLINFDIVLLFLAIVFTVLIFSISEYFGRAYLFNLLIPKLQEIHLEIVDMEKITNISVFPSALICSVISLIIALIVFPGISVIVLLISPILQLFAQGGIIFLIYFIYFLSNPLIIVYSFIFTFFSVTIATSVFNIVSPKIGGLKLKLTEEGDLTKINSMNYLNLALILGAIAAALGLTMGVILSIASMNLMATLPLIIYFVLGGFAGGFIIGALIAVFYNRLAPKMGELKIKLV